MKWIVSWLETTVANCDLFGREHLNLMRRAYLRCLPGINFNGRFDSIFHLINVIWNKLFVCSVRYVVIFAIHLNDDFTLFFLASWQLIGRKRNVQMWLLMQIFILTITNQKFDSEHIICSDKLWESWCLKVLRDMYGQQITYEVNWLMHKTDECTYAYVYCSVVLLLAFENGWWNSVIKNNYHTASLLFSLNACSAFHIVALLIKNACNGHFADGDFIAKLFRFVRSSKQSETLNEIGLT